MLKIIISLFILFFNIGVLEAKMIGFGRGNIKKELRYNFGIGFNMPQQGYDGYLNNPVFSAKLDFVRKLHHKREALNYRVSFDYFMMMVPLATYGITEDMFNISGSMIYGFLKTKKLFPYMGIGGGLYLDWIRINTAAVRTGYIHRFIGVNASVGSEIDVSEKLLLIPELTYHIIFVSGFNLSSSHLSFSMNLAFKPPKPVYRRKRKR